MAIRDVMDGLRARLKHGPRALRLAKAARATRPAAMRPLCARAALMAARARA
jgi:hypothetical protein